MSLLVNIQSFVFLTVFIFLKKKVKLGLFRLVPFISFELMVFKQRLFLLPLHVQKGGGRKVQYKTAGSKDLIHQESHCAFFACSRRPKCSQRLSGLICPQSALQNTCCPSKLRGILVKLQWLSGVNSLPMTPLAASFVYQHLGLANILRGLIRGDQEGH